MNTSTHIKSKNESVQNSKVLNTNENTKKMQLSIPRQTDILLENIAGETGAASKLEVIREAISFYAWLVDAIQKGDNILLEKPDGKFVEAVFPQLALLLPAKKILRES